MPAIDRPLIAALLVASDTTARMRSAIQPIGQLCRATTWAELRALVSDRSVHAALIEPTDQNGETADAFLRHLRVLKPWLPVLGYCHTGPSGAREIVAMMRAGVEDVILRDVDDSAASLRRLLADAEHARIAKHAFERLKPHIAPSAASLLAACLTLAHAPATVDQLALHLGVHRKTLVNRAAAARLPSPGSLISWCRLIHAAYLLRRADRTVEQVALMLEYGSGTALRLMFRRYLGAHASAVRALGGSDYVLARLVERITSSCASSTFALPCSTPGDEPAGPLSLQPRTSRRCGATAPTHTSLAH